MARFGLKDLDKTISDVSIMAKILGSLSSKYNYLITAWDNIDPTRQTLENLSEILFKKEARLSSTDEMSNALVAVFFEN